MSVVAPPPPTPPRPDELELLIRKARARRRRRWIVGAAVVAVVAGATVAAYAVASATGKRPVTSGADPGTAPRCALSELRVHRLGSYAGLGQSGGYYGFANVGRQDCSLKGWPYVVAVKADGQRATGVRVQETFYGPFKAPRRPPTIHLAPGDTAAFALTTGDNPLGNARSCPAPYIQLRIGLADGSATATLSAWIPYYGQYFQACTRFAVSEIVPRSDLRG